MAEDYTMRNVVDLGEYRFTRRDTKSFMTLKPSDCQHKHLTLDANGNTVKCDDCKAQVGAYWALQKMVENWEEWWRQVRNRGTAVQELEQKNVILKAALEVEKAWRSKTMAPCCPHCDKAILPEDGFGRRGSINKEMEVARRKRAKQPSPPTPRAPHDR